MDDERPAHDEGRAAPGSDSTIPNAARVYDYYLGGTDNFPADREFAEKVLARFPQLRTVMRENRAFLGRAVRFLVEQGVRQFVDIGSGLPTVDNVHQVAQRLDPRARVLYADYDPVVVDRANALLADSGNVAIIRADVRRPDEILDHPALRSLIDVGQPVAVLLTLVLQFVDDEDDPHQIVARLRDALAPGSYLVLSHGAGEDLPHVRAAAAEYQQASARLRLRTRDEILRFFDGFELVDPGLTDVSGWRNPTLPPTAVSQVTWAGVGRRR